MDRLRLLIVALLAAFLWTAGPGVAQETLEDAEPDGAQQTLEDAVPEGALEDSRAATGGAQTLEDILRRQRGEEIDDTFRSSDIGNPDQAAPITAPLGTLGGASDPELWRALRYGSADITTTARNPGAELLVQDSGMTWLQFREGPLREWGGWFLVGVAGLLAVFFLIRGRIRISQGRAGVRITRFSFIERLAHWTLAFSFIALAITGLFSLYARLAIGRPETGVADEASMMERQGDALISTLLIGSKWVHNNVSWAFMVALVVVFLLWVVHNIPSRLDLKWFAQGGGIIGSGHPPARKFNAGQKLIFWGVILLGASVSASGLALLFPFELPLFAKTFAALNATGLPELVGYGTLPETLTPHAEMQLSQIWHGIIAFVMMGMILAHIYIGSVGMEGAYDAMGSGEVDVNWAREHHSLWVDEVLAKEDTPPPSTGQQPAE